MHETTATVSIYGLFEPDGETLRYIGKTVLVPKKRLEAHLSEARNHKKVNHKNHWIRALTARGELPVLKVLAEIPAEGWGLVETWLIAEGRRLGIALTNNAVGGEGGSGFRHTEETRARMSAERRARGVRPPQNQGPLSEETKAKIGAKARGRKLPAEAVAKMAERMRGTKLSAETRAKISLGNKGQQRSAEQIESFRVAARRRMQDPAAREQIRDAGRRRPRKLSEADLAIVRERLAAGDRQIDIATDFGVAQSFISKIKNGLAHAPMAA